MLVGRERLSDHLNGPPWSSFRRTLELDRIMGGGHPAAQSVMRVNADDFTRETGPEREADNIGASTPCERSLEHHQDCWTRHVAEALQQAECVSTSAILGWWIKGE